MNMLCPCHSEKPYALCCRPFHEGTAVIEYPLQLMRARYAGYSLGIVDFIIATTDRKNPAFREDTKEWRTELLVFCKATEFRGLKILEDGQDTVTFLASLFQKRNDISFTEKSRFIRCEGKWYYLDSEWLKRGQVPSS